MYNGAKHDVDAEMMEDQQPKAYSYIRFSSKRQERGSSVERQMEKTEAFAVQHGLDLQDKTFEDLGVSGFRGEHGRIGQLAAFVDAVKEGKIDKGSWLLVESLDRLTRERISYAQVRLNEILSLGITVATVANNQVFEPDSRDDFGSAITILVELARAHSESQRKSDLSIGGWNRTRKDAAPGRYPKGKGGRLPWWIRKTSDGDIEVISERAEVVQEMFQYALDGLGSLRIARTLNSRGIKPQQADKWSAGSVSKILTRRFVLGEWQPMRIHIDDEGKRHRIPEGDPIHIYPQIIDEATWIRVNSIRQGRDNLSGRAASSEYPNVLSGITRCRCGAPLRYLRKAGRRPTLVCRTSEYGQECEFRRHIDADGFTTMAVHSLWPMGFGELFPHRSNKAERKLQELEAELTKQVVLLEDKKRKLGNALDVIMDEDNADVRDGLRAKAKQLSDSIREDEAALNETAAGVAVLRADSTENSEVEKLKPSEVLSLIESAEGRHRINSLIRRKVGPLIVDAKGRQIESTIKATEEALQVTWGTDLEGDAGEFTTAQVSIDGNLALTVSPGQDSHIETFYHVARDLLDELPSGWNEDWDSEDKAGDPGE